MWDGPARPQATRPPAPDPYGAGMQRNRNQQQQQQLAVLRLPEMNEVGTLVLQGVGSFAKKHKYITGWYILGVIVLFYVSQNGGKLLDAQQTYKYNNIMNSIDLQAEYDAVDKYWYAKNMYQQSKGWFWNCDSLCQRNKRRYEQAERHLNEIRAEGNAKMSDAKAVAGLTSEIAITEMKDSFWQYFTSGKRFAKRQSMWDMMFIGIRSMTRGRDESTVEFMLKVLMQVLINFSMGLLMALVFFVIGLWNIIKSYQPNPITALIIFCCAAAGATSFVVTYLLAIYGATAGGIYGLAKLAETSARQQLGADQRRQHQRIHND